jgi:hypothetical protein
VKTVERHPDGRARAVDEMLPDVGAVQVRRADRVRRQVRPVDMRAVDRQPIRVVRVDETLLDALAVEVRLPDRVRAEICPVDVGALDRHSDRLVRACDEVLRHAGAVEVCSADGV